MTIGWYLFANNTNSEIAEENELNKIYKDNDVFEFHNFMTKFSTNESLYEFRDRHHTKNELEFTIDNFIKTVAHYNISYVNNCNLMKILLMDYGLKADDDFFKKAIANMRFDMFKLFCGYFDLTKYGLYVHPLFTKLCIRGHINQIKYILNLGYDINILNWTEISKYAHTSISKAIDNNQYSIVEFLLINGVDFKKLEIDIMKQCIKDGKIDMLNLFIKYGADMQSLNTIENDMSNAKINIYNLLVSENINVLTIIQLMNQ